MRSVLIDLYVDKAANLEIAKPLAKLGYKVYALVGLNSPSSKRKYESANPALTLLSIPLKFVTTLTALLLSVSLFVTLPFILLRNRIRLVVLEADASMICVFWKPIMSLLHCKAILDIRSTPLRVDFREGSIRSFLFNLSVVLAHRMLDGITTVTSQMRDEISNNYGIERASIGVWSNGVSLQLFDPASVDPTLIRKKLGLDKKFVVFYHGSLSMHRGIAESVKSIRMLNNEYKNVVLFMVGKREDDRLDTLVSEEGLNDRVTIRNAVGYSNIPSYIAMSDVCICPLPNSPDWRNQGPLKVIEYLAMGKVVILTDIYANREVVGESKCGIYVRDADPDLIARAIEYSYRNRAHLKNWGAAGREIIERRYELDRIASDLLNYSAKL